MARSGWDRACRDSSGRLLGWSMQERLEVAEVVRRRPSARPIPGPECTRKPSSTASGLERVACEENGYSRSH